MVYSLVTGIRSCAQKADIALYLLSLCRRAAAGESFTTTVSNRMECCQEKGCVTQIEISSHCTDVRNEPLHAGIPQIFILQIRTMMHILSSVLHSFNVLRVNRKFKAVISLQCTSHLRLRKHFGIIIEAYDGSRKGPPLLPSACRKGLL